MLPLGHMGITVAIVRMVESYFKLFRVDYRLLLIASLLPDLIDKPISYFFNAQSIFIGRYYGHSLLFLLIMFIFAMIQWHWWNNPTGLIFCIGTLSHDVLDIISHHEDWAERTLFYTNSLIEFEIIGGCILTYFFWSLFLVNKVEKFMKNGEL